MWVTAARIGGSYDVGDETQSWIVQFVPVEKGIERDKLAVMA